MDTVEERSENFSFDDQIKIVDELEKFIIDKIYSTPQFYSNLSLQMKDDNIEAENIYYTFYNKRLVNENFGKIHFTTPLNFFKPIHDKIRKMTIYGLHDEGLFKESNEDRVKRLCKDSVQVPIPCKKGDNKVEKLDFEYLPKHYHEIISDIKSYRSAIETKNHTQAKIIYKSLLQQHSKHRDCYVVELLPESFQNTIDKIQLSYLSEEPDEIKEKAYIDFVEEFIKKYEYDHVFLWNALNFSRQDQNTLKELSFLSFRFIGPLKNKFAIRQTAE